MSVGLGIELPFESGLNEWVDVGRQLPLLLRPQDDVREVLPGLRRAARRLRHPRRAVRGADAGADAEGHVVPDRAASAVDYWAGLLDWLRDTVLADGKISPADLDMLALTDDVDEAVAADGPEPGRRRPTDDVVLRGPGRPGHGRRRRAGRRARRPDGRGVRRPPRRARARRRARCGPRTCARCGSRSPSAATGCREVDALLDRLAAEREHGPGAGTRCARSLGRGPTRVVASDPLRKAHCRPCRPEVIVYVLTALAAVVVVLTRLRLAGTTQRRRPLPARQPAAQRCTPSAACSPWWSGSSSWSPPRTRRSVTASSASSRSPVVDRRHRRAADPGALAARARQARLRGDRGHLVGGAGSLGARPRRHAGRRPRLHLRLPHRCV